MPYLPTRVKVLAAELPLFLMRFLSLRLKPKAAAAPKRGRGPGTDVDDGVGGWTAANVTTAVTPFVAWLTRIPIG